MNTNSGLVTQYSTRECQLLLNYEHCVYKHAGTSNLAGGREGGGRKFEWEVRGRGGQVGGAQWSRVVRNLAKTPVVGIMSQILMFCKFIGILNLFLIVFTFLMCKKEKKG